MKATKRNNIDFQAPLYFSIIIMINNDALSNAKKKIISWMFQLQTTTGD
jgi:hypothetical protein